MIQARAVCAFGVGNTPFLMLMLPIFNPYGNFFVCCCILFAVARAVARAVCAVGTVYR
jgi:hypothetical protein